MTRVVVALAVAAAAAVWAPLSAQQGGARAAPQRANRAPAAGGAAIAGRLTAAGIGSPVRGADVTAFLVDSSGVLRNPAGHQTVVTDDEGRFEFGDLPLGEWKVTASKTGYVTWQFGQRRPFESPPPIILSRGRERVAADFSIPRASTIAGRVYDELGEPVSGVHVTVYRARMAQGRRRLEQVARPDRTDDTGSFRVYGLAPGQYYVAASLRVAPADSVVETTYAPTYFPGTGNVAEAQRISLELGSEANAEFQLLSVRRLRVTGSVFTSSGAPASALLNLVSEASELGVPFGFGGATQPDGSFTLADVAPGRYTLYASLRGGEPDESVEMPLIVAFDDILGLTLVTARPSTIRGTISVDSGSTGSLPPGIGVTARSFRPGGPMTAGTLDGNTFEILAPTGPFHLEVHGMPADWAVKSIEVGGAEATDAPLDLTSQQSVTARIVLTDRVTQLRGTVMPSDSPPHSVVVFPQDATKWPLASRYIRAARVDARGNFRITGLPPGGPYLVVAVDYLEEGEGEDPEFLSSIAGRAAAVSLAEGERRTITPAMVER
jgi:hypothetical protein